MLRFLRALIALLGVFLIAPAWATTCDVGFAVTFFNGVANTFQQAVSSKLATRDAIEETVGTVFDVYDSQPISYDVAYNTTEGTLNDVFETFVQRANQIDPSGNLANNFGYLYWTYLTNSSQNYPGTISSALPPSLSAVATAIATWPQAAAGIMATSLANQLNTAPTAADIALQQATLTADANNGSLQLLVAHSQGNLFVDSANVFLSQSGLVIPGQYSTVHVAPATSTLYGPYLLSSKDLVINGLGLVFGGISPPNEFLPAALIDPKGHGYQEIYLNAGLIDSQSTLSARALLEALFRDALKSLDSQQQCQLQISGATIANPGDNVPLTATLTPALSPTLDPNHVTVKYKWSISGDADGTFTDPLTGALVTTVVTTVPNVTYHAFNAVQTGQQGTDQVSVEVDVSTPDNGATTTKVLATGATTSIMVGLTNGCYDPNSVTNQPGATYSVTIADGLPVPTGTIQENYTTVGNVAFTDPGYTTTAFETNESEVLTYPGYPNQSGTIQDVTFTSVPNSTAAVIYGSNETSMFSGTTSILNAVLSPPVPFGQVALLEVGGPAITLTYAGTATETVTSTSSTSTTVNFGYTEAWSLLGISTITVPAGTFKTCAFQIVTSISPHILDTKYKLYGYGIDVKETTMDNSSGTPVLTDTQQATAVTINGSAYFGP